MRDKLLCHVTRRKIYEERIEGQKIIQPRPAPLVRAPCSRGAADRELDHAYPNILRVGFAEKVDRFNHITIFRAFAYMHTDIGDLSAFQEIVDVFDHAIARDRVRFVGEVRAFNHKEEKLIAVHGPLPVAHPDKRDARELFFICRQHIGAEADHEQCHQYTVFHSFWVLPNVAELKKRAIFDCADPKWTFVTKIPPARGEYLGAYSESGGGGDRGLFDNAHRGFGTVVTL
ncbi:MAG: hypothetical protein HZA31_02730 [Opitutae bacterium]|nr:hypothetical protein [Opitutae bacterium]